MATSASPSRGGRGAAWRSPRGASRSRPPPARSGHFGQARRSNGLYFSSGRRPTRCSSWRSDGQQEESHSGAGSQHIFQPQMKPMQIDARPLAAALYDGIALALAALAAAFLLDPNGPSTDRLDLLFAAFAIAIPIQVGVNVFFGIYQGVWRYTSLPDIQRIIFAVLAGTVCTAGALGAVGLEGAFGMRESV